MVEIRTNISTRDFFDVLTQKKTLSLPVIPRRPPRRTEQSSQPGKAQYVPYCISPVYVYIRRPGRVVKVPTYT